MQAPSQWHPGRFRRGVPILGKPSSDERKAQIPLVEAQCDLNKDIKDDERQALIQAYLSLSLK